MSPQTQLSTPLCILSRWQVHFAGMDNAGAMAQLQALHQIQGMGGMGGVQVSCAMLRCVVLLAELVCNSLRQHAASCNYEGLTCAVYPNGRHCRKELYNAASNLCL